MDLDAAAETDEGPAALARAAFRPGSIYLNAAALHPMPRIARAALHAYAERRGVAEPTGTRGEEGGWELRELFGRLVNVSPRDVVLIPSTTMGENLIALGLGLGEGRGAVVTDALHFEGSLVMYAELARRGVGLTVVPQREGRIRLEDYAAAIGPDTTLVAVSAVSNVNGFQHDLRALCELAHAHGALVFADVIQAAGAVPLDIPASGVDACAASSYKWLMGDFGAGLLYVKPEARARIARVLYGHDQIARFVRHGLPFDPPAPPAFDYALTRGAHGRFALGTKAAGAIAATTASLRAIIDAGIETLQARRRPLVARLQAELPALGYRPLTPPNSTAPIATFVCERADERLGPALRAAGVTISLYANRFRISPSVHNTDADVDRLLDVLAGCAPTSRPRRSGSHQA